MRRTTESVSTHRRLHRGRLSIKPTVRCGKTRMRTPDSNRIIETHIPIASLQPDDYLAQLRTDVLPHIRDLQSGGCIEWFSFLLHPASLVAGRPQDDEAPVFHLRLEPASRLTLDEFINHLPAQFRDPHAVNLAEIGELDGELLAGGDWARAWRAVGEASEWVLCLVEAHADSLPPEHVFRFLHYMTNALGLGLQCIYVSTPQNSCDSERSIREPNNALEHDFVPRASRGYRGGSRHRWPEGAEVRKRYSITPSSCAGVSSLDSSSLSSVWCAATSLSAIRTYRCGFSARPCLSQSQF